MSAAPPNTGPSPTPPTHSSARCLLGGGALCSLLGGITAELSIFLLLFGIAFAWVASTLLLAGVLVIVGLLLLVAGGRAA